MTQVRCPTCDQPFDPQHSRALPFCSDRCRQIDLNRWLKEEIGMPLGEVSPEEDRPPHRDDADDD
jgi:endogenous inhibitor of DNA gyrase (YacG/DUF329 family)